MRPKIDFWGSFWDAFLALLYIKGRESEGGRAKYFDGPGGWQIFFEGPGGSFFRVFFLHRFFIDFSSILEGFWKPTCVPKSILERFLGCFFWYPLFVAFFDAF